MTDEDSGTATTRIFELLCTGEYMENGRRHPVKGDISKLERIIGLTDTQRAIIRNYHFMSSRIAGTRQVRNSIRHLVFASRIPYGAPVFLTVTPSERHSGLAIRLFRGRRRDPGFTCAAQSRELLLPYVGYNAPSLVPPSDEDDMEVATAEVPALPDLPEYDQRRLITARDPLCCVNAFLVATRVVFPALFGMRMCPRCPHCALTETPCMDAFGSNATPMGGELGRGDAAIGAVEAQKAEGVLHLHVFVYPQMVNQYETLQEIAYNRAF